MAYPPGPYGNSMHSAEHRHHPEAPLHHHHRMAPAIVHAPPPPPMAPHQRHQQQQTMPPPHRQQQHHPEQQQQQHRHSGEGGYPPPPTRVLLVRNLNEMSITPEALFTLFGVYGDVQRVKILHGKRHTALIQLADSAQAQRALRFLDRVKLHGRPMEVKQSRFQEVQMPHVAASDDDESQPGWGITRDYSNSPMHRFKGACSKNHDNVCAPSRTLHLSNIPQSESDSDDWIADAFAEAGFRIVAFKFFQSDRRMALIELESIDEAAAALIQMHNADMRAPVGGGATKQLRVSFTKSTIKRNDNRDQ